MYGLLFRLVLMRFPAEAVHRLAFALLRLVMALAPLRRLCRRWFGPAPTLAMQVFGRTVPGPVGLAAGFDKDARAFEGLAALGFGFVEIGTLTPLPQAGNPRPRMWRLPRDRALLNRLGFNNRGIDAAAPRLGSPRQTFVGVNIGKNKVTPPEDAIGDYIKGAERLGRHADYLVVNVSSPNTPGLRALQQIETLRKLLVAVRATLDRTVPDRRVPLLVKIDPDLADAELDGIAALALELGLDGIIATNTTVKPQGLLSPPEDVGDPPRGGISGAPLKARSVAVLRRLRAGVGDRLTLISVGGIETVDDVWTRLCAGASLVQLYSAFIYGGPLLPRRLHRELEARLRASGKSSLAEVIGSDAAAASGAA